MSFSGIFRLTLVGLLVYQGCEVVGSSEGEQDSYGSSNTSSQVSSEELDEVDHKIDEILGKLSHDNNEIKVDGSDIKTEVERRLSEYKKFAGSADGMDVSAVTEKLETELKKKTRKSKKGVDAGTELILHDDNFIRKRTEALEEKKKIEEIKKLVAEQTKSKEKANELARHKQDLENIKKAKKLQHIQTSMVADVKRDLAELKQQPKHGVPIDKDKPTYLDRKISKVGDKLNKKTKITPPVALEIPYENNLRDLRIHDDHAKEEESETGPLKFWPSEREDERLSSSSLSSAQKKNKTFSTPTNQKLRTKPKTVVKNLKKSSGSVPLPKKAEECKVVVVKPEMRESCSCPSGMELCTYKDAEQSMQSFSNKSGKTHGLGFGETICSGSLREETSVYVDANTMIECDQESKLPGMVKYNFELGSHNVSHETLEKLVGKELPPPPYGSTHRDCSFVDFYLCRPITQKHKEHGIDCEMDSWGLWNVYCVNNMQTRSRYIAKSAEKGGEPCMWEDNLITTPFITENRVCPDDIPDHRRYWSNTPRGSVTNLSQKLHDRRGHLLPDSK